MLGDVSDGRDAAHCSLPVVESTSKSDGRGALAAHSSLCVDEVGVALMLVVGVFLLSL